MMRVDTDVNRIRWRKIINVKERIITAMSVNPAGDKLGLVLSNPSNLPSWYKYLYVVVINTLDGLNEKKEF